MLCVCCRRNKSLCGAANQIFFVFNFYWLGNSQSEFVTDSMLSIQDFWLIVDKLLIITITYTF